MATAWPILQLEKLANNQNCDCNLTAVDLKKVHATDQNFASFHCFIFFSFATQHTS